MHEKVAFIDREVVWHGSLNILSHKDTTESMLRLNSAAMYEQVAFFLMGRRWPKGESPGFAAPENPGCWNENCRRYGVSMVLNTGRNGIWFECSECGAKANARGEPQRPRGARQPPKRAGNNVTQRCPQCGKPLTQRKGQFGVFLGCTGYPKCRYTRNLPN